MSPVPLSREEGADTLAVTQLAGLAGLEFHMGAQEDALRIALDALDQWQRERPREDHRLTLHHYG